MPQPDTAAVPGYGDLQAIINQAASSIPEETARRKAKAEEIAQTTEATGEKLKGYQKELDDSYAAKAELNQEYADKISELAPQKPPELHETSPIQAFGSFATILGALGGLLSRQPLTASLNAAAGAMRAIHSRDLENYDYQVKQWKVNAEHAHNLLEWQNKRYAALLEQFNDKPKQISTAIQIEAAINEQPQIAEAFRKGAYDEGMNLLGVQFKMGMQLQDHIQRANEFAESKREHLQNEAFRQEQLKMQREDKQERRAEALERLETPERVAFKKFLAEKPEAGADEIGDFVRKLHARSTGSEAELVSDHMRQWAEENPTATAEDWRDEYAKTKMSAAAGKLAGIDRTQTAISERAANKNSTIRDVTQAKIDAARLHDEGVLGQRQAELLARLNIAKDNRESKEGIAARAEEGRNARNEKADATKRYQTEVRKAIEDRKGDIKEDEFTQTLGFKNRVADLTAQKIDADIAHKIAVDEFNQAKEEHRAREAAYKLGQEDKKIEIRDAMKDLAKSKDERQGAQQWAKIAQYDRRLGQYDEHIQNEAEKVRQGGEKTDATIDQGWKRIQNSEQYQAAALALRKAGLDRNQANDVLKQQWTGWNQNFRERQENDKNARAQVSAEFKNRTDAAIVNDLANYPGLKQQDLGYIPPDSQKQIKAAQASAHTIETAAAIMLAQPGAVGAIGKAQVAWNIDALKDLADRTGMTKTLKYMDDQLGVMVQRREITPDDAAAAKLLNKALTTQAFLDAAAFNARPSVFLDKQFKEIYQQASKPSTLAQILMQRYKDADRIRDQYRLGFDHRSDLDKLPFWKTGEVGWTTAMEAQEVWKKDHGKYLPVIESKTSPAYRALQFDEPYISSDGGYVRITKKSRE